jgi:hypothetical protein
VAKLVRVNEEYFILEKDGIQIIGIPGAPKSSRIISSSGIRIVRQQIQKGRTEQLAAKGRSLTAFLAKTTPQKKHAARHEASVPL